MTLFKDQRLALPGLLKIYIYVGHDLRFPQEIPINIQQTWPLCKKQTTTKNTIVTLLEYTDQVE